MSPKKSAASALEEEAYQQELRESIRWLKLTVTKIQQLGIAANPENYAIWYTYYSGAKPELKQALDRRLNSKLPFTPELCHQFFSQYFVEGPEQQLAQIRKALRTMISNLSAEINELDSGLSSYDAFLTGCELELGKDPEVGNLTVMIQNLLSQTKNCRSQNSQALKKVGLLNKEVQVLQKSMQVISDDALEDPLTGLGSVRGFEQELANSLAECAKEGSPLVLLMLAVDKFSDINELHGHLVGDRVLRFISIAIRKTVKGKDYVARCGVYQFAVILQNTSAEGGLVVAQSILKNVASTKLTVNREGESLGKVTLSAGVCLAQKNETASALANRTEACLKQAKARDCNQIASDQD